MSTALVAKLSAKKTRYKQRNVADALQQLIAVFAARRVGRVGKHQRQRLDAAGIVIVGVEIFGAGEQRHHIDDVVRGVRIDRNSLLRHRRVDCAAKVVAKITYRYYPATVRLIHRASPPGYALYNEPALNRL